MAARRKKKNRLRVKGFRLTKNIFTMICISNAHAIPLLAADRFGSPGVSTDSSPAAV